jgi:hypothetical protein
MANTNNDRTLPFTKNRQAYLDIVAEELKLFPGMTITRKQVVALDKSRPDAKWPSWLTGDKNLRGERGLFILPTLEKKATNAVEANTDADSNESTEVEAVEAVTV